MASTGTKYHLLSEEDLVQEPRDRHDPSLKPISSLRSYALYFIILALLLSFTSNVVLGFALYGVSHQQKSQYSYAGLEWSKKSTWVDDSPYFDRSSRQHSDTMWEAIDFSNGIVAIDDQEAEDMGIPKSQRFPWDESKGIYLINSHHNLHCLKWLWKSLAKFRDGGKFEMIDWHGFHCLDSLRQDVLCYADDTPRYTGEGQSNQSSGFHQTRKCRDWDQLETWAMQHTACYRFLDNSVYDTLDRHKFCPEGSPYNEQIERMYGREERARLIDLYGEVAA